MQTSFSTKKLRARAQSNWRADFSAAFPGKIPFVGDVPSPAQVLVVARKLGFIHDVHRLQIGLQGLVKLVLADVEAVPPKLQAFVPDSPPDVSETLPEIIAEIQERVVPEFLPPGHFTHGYSPLRLIFDNQTGFNKSFSHLPAERSSADCFTKLVDSQ